MDAIITADALNTFFQVLIAFILAVIAWMNKTRTDAAVSTQRSNEQIATTNTTLAAQPAPVAVTVNLPEPYIGKDTRERDAQGRLTTDIKNGNQFWLAKDYTGPEPSHEIKKAYDSLYGFNAALDNQVRQYGETYGKENLSPDVATLGKK